MSIETPSPQTISFGDFVQTFQIEDLNIRGRLVRLEESFATAVKDHGYPAPLKRLVGETMVLASILGSALKYDGVFSLQAQGSGAVSLLMADITSDGAMRAYAKAKDGVELDDGETVSIPQLMGSGHMALTVDQGADMDRYQGITELNGATLAECAQNYFRQSEQLETAIAIVSDEGASGGKPRAAGLMVQRLPAAGDGHEEEKNWRRAVILMSSIKPDELLDETLSASKVLFRLYHEDGVRLFESRPMRHECRCSKARVQRTILSFPKDEIAEMAEDGRITVTCEFCRADYVYDVETLDVLYAEAHDNQQET